MKKIKNLVLVATVLIGLTGYATEINIVPAENVTTLQFTDVKKGQQITIKDDANITLYAEIITGDGFYSKKFDFTALDNGAYTIELIKDCEVIVKSFIINEQKISFTGEEEIKLFKPTARIENNRLLVSQLALNDDSLSVEIYFQGELIHTDTIAGNAILSRIYQLSDLKKGNYSVHMNSNNRLFVQNFTI